MMKSALKCGSLHCLSFLFALKMMILFCKTPRLALPHLRCLEIIRLVKIIVCKWVGECIVLFISNYYFWYGICPSKTINFFQEIIILKKFNRTLAQASHTILFCLRPLRPSETIFSSLGYYCPISARVAALDKFWYKILKVSKFRKQIVLFSFEPKTKQNISALRIDP